MKYYVRYDQNHEIALVGTNCGGTEITEAEHNELLTMIRTKADLVNKLYANEITLEDVPTEWQDEIQRKVDERIELEGAMEEQDISTDEFVAMLDEVM